MLFAVFAGWFIIALSSVQFYRFGKDIRSDDEKKRSYAWLYIVSGIFTILAGANIVSRASQTAYHSAPSPYDNSGATFSMTDPKTGRETTVPLTNEEMKQFQSNPSAILTKKALEAQSSR